MRHCPEGHPICGDNVVISREHGRDYERCRICKNARQRAWRHKTGASETDKVGKPLQKRCNRGHPLVGPNVYVTPKLKQRRCVVCRREYARQWQRQKRAKERSVVEN